MKLVTYQAKHVNGAVPSPGFGVVVDGGVVDARAALGGGYASLLDLLATGALDRLFKALSGRAPDFALDEVVLLPPVPNPGKILCAGINYQTHREETARPATQHPMLFARFADSQMGHGSPALKPSVTDKFDYEGELAVVIGTTADAVTIEAAMSHVAGYACYNDFSARDWQRHTSQFLPGKNFRGTGAFGPWLVTADEIADIRQSRLQTWVNGDLRQSALVSDMVFSIEQLISYISTFTVLHPGDVVVTGTPGGVGLFRDPPEFLKSGDRVEVEVTGVGRLENVVA